MSARSLARWFQRALSAELGDGKDYYRLVVFPQAFTFVLLVVVASFIYPQLLSLTLVYLGSIAAVFVWSVLYRVSISEQDRFREWMLFYELGSITSVLLSLSLLLRVHPLLGFYLPVALLLGTTVVFSLSWLLKGAFATLGAGSVLLYWVLHELLRDDVGALVAEGGWVVGFSVLLLAFRPQVKRDHPSRDRLLADSTIPEEDDLDEPEVPVESEWEEIDAEWDQLLAFAEKQVRKEFASEFSLRLGGIFLFFATTVLLIAFLNASKNRLMGLCLLGCMFVYAFSHHSMLRKKSIAALNRVGLLGAFSVFCMVLLLHLFQVSDPLTVFFLTILFQLSLGVVPWRKQAVLLLACGMFLFGVLLVTMLQFPAPLLLFSPAVLAFSLRNALLARLGVLARVVPLVVSQRMSVVSTRSLLYLLAHYMGQILCADRALLVGQSDPAEIVERGRHRESDVDEIFSRGLIQRVKDFGRDGGLLVGFSRQFRPALREWFHRIPSQLLFVRLTPVLEQKPEEVLVLVPYSWPARVVGQHRLIAAISTASSLVRAWTMGRSRYSAADLIVSSQRTIKESEHELNQVVHRVNNVAQDVSIQCEELRELLAGNGNLALSRERSEECINHILRAVRFLSTGASDVKLIKELLRVRNYQHDEPCRVELLVEELRAYGEYLSFQYGNEFEMDVNVAEGEIVRVASREFLESCLRTSMRLAIRPGQPELRLQLRILSEASSIRFQVLGSGEGMTEEERARVIAEKFPGVQRETDYLRALVNLARLSGGAFRFREPEEEGVTSCIELELPRADREQRPRASRGDWVLLVDDSPAVTTFYSRIMDALELSHETADSLERAEAVLRRNGQPKLVITDVQLGDGSGLDLVERVRTRFGERVPIFVVSGETDAELVSRAKRAGANLYLTKPVGRRKLFAEIQNVLV